MATALQRFRRRLFRGGRPTARLALAGLGLLLGARRARRRKLRGQVVLITGGSRGLGLALGRELTEHGCKLVLCARDAEELERAAADLRARGGEVLTVTCDLTSDAQVESLVRQAIAHYGRVDVLCNNAGVIQIGPHDTMDLDDFRQAIEVMYFGLVHPTLAVLPHMKARAPRRSALGGLVDAALGRPPVGQIVNITSIGGKVSVPHLLPYAGAKFAAVGFSEGLLAELQGTGIEVITVVPGLMRTGSVRNVLVKGTKEAELSWFSLGAALPGVSLSAERAAKRIVAAMRRGQAEVILGAPARALALVHGLWPGLTARLLGLVNRLGLPESPADAEEGHRIERGADIEPRLGRGPLGAVAERAARVHQKPAEDLNQPPTGHA